MIKVYSLSKSHKWKSITSLEESLRVQEVTDSWRDAAQMSQSLSAPYFISYCVTPLCLDTQWRPSLYWPRVPSSPRKKSLLVIIMTLWVSDLCKRRDNGLGKRWPVFKVRGVSCCAGWRDRPAPTPHYQHLIYRDNDSSLPWSLFLCPGHTTTRGISVPSRPQALSDFSINLFH